MNMNSMGEFIAALRKSKGMTQQDLADKLSITNKAVSKWERGEGYPEVSLIPALAEVLGVTTDEIFRGERIPEDERDGKNKAKVEKRIRAIVSRAVTRFKNYMFFATALVSFGLIMLYAVSYAFYKPIIGFSINLVFIAAGMLTALIALNITGSSVRSSDLSEELSELIEPYRQIAGKYMAMFSSFCAASFIVSLPFVIIREPSLPDSVVQPGYYFRMLPVLLIVSIAVGVILNRIILKVQPCEATRRYGASRRFLIALTVSLAVTFAGHIAITLLIKAPIPIQYENREEFSAFAEGWKKYKEDFQYALENGYIIMDENQVERDLVGVKQQVFEVDPVYEEVLRLDEDTMAVYKKQNPTLLEKRTNYTDTWFATLYLLEMAVVGGLYLRKRTVNK